MTKLVNQGCSLLRRLALILLTGMMSGAVLAKAAKDATMGEIALLPPYCIDTEAFTGGHEHSPKRSPRASYWVSQMGKGFWSLHHYCWALVNVRRTVMAARMPAARRAEELRLNQSEFYYVLDNTPPDFVLLPEIYTKIGESELMIFEYLNGTAPEHLLNAGTAFEKARSLKPDYWPAYSKWAETLLRLGRRDEAKEIVEKGLSHAPDSTALQDLARRVQAESGEPSGKRGRSPGLAKPPASGASRTGG